MRNKINKRWLKHCLRWGVWGITLFVIAHKLRVNWSAVQTISLTAIDRRWLIAAWAISLLAHSWAGWVWHWLLRLWGIAASGWWAMRVYLSTNVAKYLPGNFWHFYGRVRAIQNRGGSLGQSISSVVAEPLVMAVAAVGLGAIFSTVHLLSELAAGDYAQLNRIGSGPIWTLGLFCLWAIALILLHPKWLNPRLQKMSRLKLPKLRKQTRPNVISTHATRSTAAATAKTSDDVTLTLAPPMDMGVLDAGALETDALETDTLKTNPIPTGDAATPQLQLRHYPVWPLLGEMGFVLGRSLGFIATMLAISPLNLSDIGLLISAYSLAWLLGLVVPGAPGGIGVFEASAIVLLEGQFPIGTIIGSVALYRLISTLSEVTGAAIAWSYSALSEGFE